MCKCYIVISDTPVGSFLDVLQLLLALICQSFMKNQDGKIELQKKAHRRIRGMGMTFSTAHPPFYVSFLLLSLYVPFTFPSIVLTKWYIILLWLVFCVMISWANGQKYENLLQFNTSWLAYYFRFFLASVVLAMTLH